jgi:hypothetical protein
MVTFPRKKEDELREAYGHLEYFKAKGEALEKAVGQMKEDLRICQKEAKTWEGRIETLEGKAKA